MRNIYERPLMRVEMFVANNAVSTCTVEGGFEYPFDCMFGTEIDKKQVVNDIIASGCGTNIGYAQGYDTARDYAYGFGHSNNNPSRATWTYSSDRSYLQVTYSGAKGLLYTDGDANIDKQVWSQESGYVKHSKAGGGTHHMVAPVVDTASINASW